MEAELRNPEKIDAKLEEDSFLRNKVVKIRKQNW
jgi:hypothetical protein